MIDLDALNDAINGAAEISEDMNEASAFTGFTLPAEGFVRLRFVEYIELGQHMEKFEGKDKKVEKAFFKFELHGPNHPLLENGQPQTMSFTLTKSLNEKAKFYKLFRRMNAMKQVKIFAQLVGEAFIANIFHNETGEGANSKKYANFYGKDKEFTIRPPVNQNFDPESGQTVDVPVPVPARIMPPKVFLWTMPNPTAHKAMWDSIFIDGMFDDKKDEKTGEVLKKGTSKNYFQNMIRKAVNFKGSPISDILGGADTDSLEIGDAETVERKTENVQASAEAKVKAGADPLDVM